MNTFFTFGISRPNNQLILLLSLFLFCNITLAQNSGLSDYEAMMLYLDKFNNNEVSTELRNQIYVISHENIERGHQVYLESLENNEFLNIYEKPGLSWSLCNRKSKIKSNDCLPIGWLDRKSYISTLTANNSVGNAETIETFVQEALPQSQEDIDKKKEPIYESVSYTLVYFRYTRYASKITKPSDLQNTPTITNEGIGWIKSSLLSEENHTPFYKSSLTKLQPYQSPTSNDEGDDAIGEWIGSQRPIQNPPQTNKAFPKPRKKPPFKQPQAFNVIQSKPKQKQILVPVPAPVEIPKNPLQNPEELDFDLVSYLADQIKPLTGMCFNPSTKKTNELKEIKRVNPFDILIYPEITESIIYRTNNGQLDLVKLSKIANTKIDVEDIVTIDALARTLYGEMGICFKHGLHYPMAVAKIALNRSRSDELAFFRFTNSATHIQGKSKLNMIVTTPSQFQSWIPKEEVRIENKSVKTTAFKQTLCPPSNPNKNFYLGYKPDIDQLNIWTNAVRIATEAVLFPDKFDKRTHSITGTLYSSGLAGNPWDKKKVFRKIEGRSLSLESCIQIWVD